MEQNTENKIDKISKKVCATEVLVKLHDLKTNSLINLVVGVIGIGMSKIYPAAGIFSAGIILVANGFYFYKGNTGINYLKEKYKI